MTSPQPTYRYRGNVAPSAEVSRPVAVRRNAAAGSGTNQSEATSATVDIFDVIDSWGGWWGISAREVDQALAQVSDVDTLYVRINSPGGEALEGVAIGNLLRAHPASVHVTVYGLAASAASAIAMAGDTVAVGPGTMVMIHDASNIAWGNAADLRAEAAVLDTLSDGYAGLYAAKAGGTAAEWRDRMRAETWYTAEGAVEAKLADRVGLDPAPAPVETGTDLDEELAELLESMAAQDSARTAARAARRFDLTVFTHAPAALLPAGTQTPAEPPVNHPTNTKESNVDELEKVLRERLGISADASLDLNGLTAALDEALTEKADPPATPAGTDTDTIKAATAALAAAGKVIVSQNVLDELRAGATAGAAARAKQLEEERDDAVAKAFSDGKISDDRRAAWKASWDKDPEGTKADLASLPARFPVAALPGYPSADADVETAPFSDDEAGALAQLAGVSKEGLLR